MTEKCRYISEAVQASRPAEPYESDTGVIAGLV
jgi:hypothetical protein